MLLSRIFNVGNISFDAIQENKILTKMLEFTVPFTFHLWCSTMQYLEHYIFLCYENGMKRSKTVVQNVNDCYMLMTPHMCHGVISY